MQKSTENIAESPNVAENGRKCGYMLNF